jgi:hypothetical protein
VAFFGESARSYLDLFDDVSTRATAGGYSGANLLDDGRRYWSKIAGDWARAWRYGLETLEEVAEEGLDAGFTPPGVPREAGRGAARAFTTSVPRESEATVIPVGMLASADQAVSSHLTSIEAGGAMILSKDVTVTVQPAGDGTVAAELQTTNTTVPPGLYVGQLESAEGRALAPVQLYVSRATEV